MKYLKFTYVDAVTGVPITDAPAVNGPKFPDLEGLEFVWARESRYPTSVPEFFGTCPDDVFAAVPGVIDVLTQEDWESMQAGEREARKARISDAMQRKIRAIYPLEDEMYFARIGVGVSLGVYTFQPGEQEALLEFGHFVEAVRQWGRDERAKIWL